MRGGNTGLIGCCVCVLAAPVQLKEELLWRGQMVIKLTLLTHSLLCQASICLQHLPIPPQGLASRARLLSMRNKVMQQAMSESWRLTNAQSLNTTNSEPSGIDRWGHAHTSLHEDTQLYRGYQRGQTVSDFAREDWYTSEKGTAALERRGLTISEFDRR